MLCLDNAETCTSDLVESVSDGFKLVVDIASQVAVPGTVIDIASLMTDSTYPGTHPECEN